MVVPIITNITFATEMKYMQKFKIKWNTDKYFTNISITVVVFYLQWSRRNGVKEVCVTPGTVKVENHLSSCELTFPLPLPL